MASTTTSLPYSMTSEERKWLYDHHRALVEIPTVSDPSAFQMEQMQACVAYLQQQLEELGFSTRTVQIDGSAPYLLAERPAERSDAPTLILYNHYDVQPVDVSQWDTPPFILTEKEGCIYGRGAADNKGGIMATLAMLRMAKARNIPLPHIKILFEGEEEAGSPHLTQLFSQEKAFLQADAMIVMDGEDPAVLASASRGIADVVLKGPELSQSVSSTSEPYLPLQHRDYAPRYLHVSLAVHGLEKPYHSGIGVLLPDCTQGLAEMIVSLSDAKTVGKIQVLSLEAGHPNGPNVIQDSARCTLAIPVDRLDDLFDIKEAINEFFKVHPTAKGFEWEISIPEILHGAASQDDSVLGLVRLIHSLKAPETIDGFLEGAEPLSEEERALIRATSQTEEEYCHGKGMLPSAELRGDPAESIDERIISHPSVSILNMSSHTATVSIRTVAGQDPDHVAKVVAAHLNQIAAQYQLPIHAEPQTDGAWAWKAEITHPASIKYMQSLKKAFPNARFQPCGGTNPLLAAIAQIGIPAVVPANQTPTSNAHSHNENQDLESWELSIGCYLDFVAQYNK